MNTLRNTAGQYDVGHDALCVCGHVKGLHTVGNGRAYGNCICHEYGPEDGGTREVGMDFGPDCNCLKFKKAKR